MKNIFIEMQALTEELIIFEPCQMLAWIRKKKSWGDELNLSNQFFCGIW